MPLFFLFLSWKSQSPLYSSLLFFLLCCCSCCLQCNVFRLALGCLAIESKRDFLLQAQLYSPHWRSRTEWTHSRLKRVRIAIEFIPVHNSSRRLVSSSLKMKLVEKSLDFIFYTFILKNWCIFFLKENQKDWSRGVVSLLLSLHHQLLLLLLLLFRLLPFGFFFLSLSLLQRTFCQPASCPPPPAAFGCLQKIANGQHDRILVLCSPPFVRLPPQLSSKIKCIINKATTFLSPLLAASPVC